MTIFIPMQTEVFDLFRESHIASYAEAIIMSGRWPSDSAFMRARESFENLLPQGLATPGHYLYEIMDAIDGVTVGYFWFFVKEKFGIGEAFICDIVIKEEYRRQGHAERAFIILESMKSKLKFSSVSLHVFAYNIEAQALYSKLGYNISGILMNKVLNI